MRYVRVYINKFIILLTVFSMGCSVKLIGESSSSTSGSGGGGGSGGGCASTVAVTVSPVYPTNGANWMDYVKDGNGGTNAYDQPDTACTSGWTSGCIHGGEKKKVVTSETSCTGLTLTESRGYFNWECRVDGGFATFYTIGLKNGTAGTAYALGDLLLDTTAFKTNYVTIAKNSCTTAYQSSAATWWTNTITTPTSNSAGGDVALALTGSGTIYALDGDTDSQGYNINSDKVAFVMMGGKTLKYAGKASNNFLTASGEIDTSTGTGIALLATGAQNYLWIEGKFNTTPTAGTNASYGVFLFGNKFNRLSGVTIINSQTTNLYVNSTTYSEFDQVKVGNSKTGNSGVSLVSGTNYNKFYDLESENSLGSGLTIDSSSNNQFVLLKCMNNQSYGIALTGTSADNAFTQVISSANNYGIYATTSGTGNDFLMSTLANNVAQNVLLNTVTNFYLQQAVLANSGGQGMYLASSDFNKFGQIISVHNLNGTNDVQWDNNSDNNTFKAGTVLGTTATNTCIIGWGAGNEIQDATCQHGSGFGEAPSVTALGSTTFVGQLGSPGDSVNPDDANGVAAYNSMTDWINFENFYRAWGGYSALSFPDTATATRCGSGLNCQIWDWRAKSGGSTNVVNVNGTFTASAACPTSADGSTAASYITSPGAVKQLLNAVEVIGDGIGNDNGRCESSESCIYAPHIGAYQGEGTYTSTCTYTGTQVTGVTLYKYATLTQ